MTDRFGRIVSFAGAGVSAESGVPTYRGRGGIWGQYFREEHACTAGGLSPQRFALPVAGTP